MGQIKLIRDHNLKLSPIVVPLSTPKTNEASGQETSALRTLSQTAIYGILAPLIKINDIVVNNMDIVYFELDNQSNIPSLYFIVQDPNNLLRGLQTPSTDNEVRIQILPKFENAYKKIDMVFYISRCANVENGIEFFCTYKVLDLYQNHIKSFGELTTYELFDKLSIECQLGFASNIESTNDKRYLYCASETYESFMGEVISYSGDGQMGIKSQVLYDYWIDYWNNINLVDVYERFLSVDPIEDLMIWVSPLQSSEHDNTKYSTDDELYMEVPAIISNHPTTTSEDLSINSYNIVNSSTAISSGTDRIYSTYNMQDSEALDYLLSDGDQRKDIAVKYHYLGEYNREYNYLLSNACRGMKKDKMWNEIIEVVLYAPTLAITKGSKVNLHWYDTNNDLQNIKESVVDEDIQTNIIIPQSNIQSNTDSGPKYDINKQISGQYYVLSNKIAFYGNNWYHTLRLTRPRDQKYQYIEGLTEKIEKQL